MAEFVLNQKINVNSEIRWLEANNREYQCAASPFTAIPGAEVKTFS